MVNLTGQNFQEVISEGTVLVDFWAPWCGPCRMVEPQVVELSEEFEGRAVVGKVNIDTEPQIAQSYGVRAVPTFIIFRDGQPVDQIVGATNGKVLKGKLAQHTVVVE